MKVLYKKFSQIVTLENAFNKEGRNLLPEDLSILENSSIIVENGKIVWVGLDSELPKNHSFDETVHCTGKIVLPEFVDSHTHLLYAGDRSNEYFMRLSGATYEEIAKAGGGILSSQKAFSQINSDQLLQLAHQRIVRMNSYGVGSIEIKSGYGLTHDLELMAMQTLKKIKDKLFPSTNIITTYMAAHAVPKSFSSSKEYLLTVVLPLMKIVKDQNLADFVDIFHEQNYFTAEDVQLLFEEAQKLLINRRIHADEFNDNAGGSLAAKYQCFSADHLLAISDSSIDALSQSKTVATLLPGTGFFLGKPQARARDILDGGCRVAIATDFNPGSCHFDNLFSLACWAAPTYKMNPAELISSITLNAAYSLNLREQGAIIEGMNSRLAVFNCNSLAQLIYDWGINHFDYFIR